MLPDINGWESLTLAISNHTAKFGDFRHCGSGDEMFLICNMISKDQVFKGLCDFMGGSYS